jgi:hypothetical protein
MNPSLVQYELGETVHGQRLLLTREKGSNWVLTKEAVCQRDERCVIFGIPSKVLLAIAEAVRKQEAIEKS